MKVLPPLTSEAIMPEHDTFILSSRGDIKRWRVVMGVAGWNQAIRLCTILQMQSDSRNLGIQYSIVGRNNCEFR